MAVTLLSAFSVLPKRNKAEFYPNCKRVFALAMLFKFFLPVGVEFLVVVGIRCNYSPRCIPRRKRSVRKNKQVNNAHFHVCMQE